MENEHGGYLRATAGFYDRSVITSFDRTYRFVKVEHCRVIGGDPKILNSDFQNVPIEFNIYERQSNKPLWENDNEKIGAIALDRAVVIVHVPSSAFDPIWEAALATDGVFRRLRTDYVIRDENHVAVTEFSFEEVPPQDQKPDIEKSGRPAFVKPRTDSNVFVVNSTFDRILSVLKRVAIAVLVLYAIIAFFSVFIGK